MSRKAHRRLHRYIVVNSEDKFCYTLDGEKLDTLEKSIEYYRSVLAKYNDIDTNIEIINYG